MEYAIDKYNHHVNLLEGAHQIINLLAHATTANATIAKNILKHGNTRRNNI